MLKPSFFFIEIFMNVFLEYALKSVAKPESTKSFFDLLNEIFLRTEMYKSLSMIKPVKMLVNELA